MVRTSIRAATRPPLLGAAPAILRRIPAHVLTLLDIVADLSTGGVATLVASASVEVCLLDGERDTTREIGSMGLLSSGQPQKSTAGRLGPRGRKILALIPALVLVTGVFVFFGREARAQQLELQHTATSFGIAVEQTTGATLFETSRTEKPPVETSPAETPPADRSEPPALEPWPVDRQDSESPDAAETTLRIRDSSSGWAPLEKPWLGPKTNLAPPVALTPEPVESELSALESVPETLSRRGSPTLLAGRSGPGTRTGSSRGASSSLVESGGLGRRRRGDPRKHRPGGLENLCGGSYPSAHSGDGE